MVLLTRALAPADSPLVGTADPAAVTWAQHWLEPALEPELGYVWYYTGLTLRTKKEWKPALKALEQAIELNPELAEAYIAQATVLAFGYGNHEQARAKAEEGIQLGSQNTSVLLEGGRFFLDIGDNERGEGVLKAAAELEPGNLHVLVQLGRSLFAQERFTEALEIFEQASMIQTGGRRDAIAHVWLGRTYLGLERPQQALREFELAAQLNPADSDNFVRLGYAYWLTGKEDEALQAYQQALSIDPANERARERIADLRKGEYECEQK
jgi:tetratricopeptide (TPR) repeat protein